MRPDVWLACSEGIDEPDPDREPLDAALDAAGIKARWAAWTDATVDWGAARLCYPRATWDYHLDRGRFLRWVRATGQLTRLRNPVQVIEWNTDKSYMVRLAESGIACVPTRVVPRGAAPTLNDVRRDAGWERVVIKPAVSCSSWNTYAVDVDEERDELWGRLVAERDMLVQPFVASVETTGERSAVVIDGELTHVIRKSPRFEGGVESVSGPFEPSPTETALVAAALRWIDEPLDYARVDMVADESGAPMIAELELVEPSLFFEYSPRALERFVAVIERQLQQS